MPKKPPSRAQPPSRVQPQPAESGDQDVEAQLERFEEDLSWCIEQLKLGMETQTPGSRQGAEAAKVMKILLSSKAPVIKKRQAMRSAFGDYHQKRREQETKSAAAVKKMKLTTAPSTASSKSLFFRKSSSSASQTSQSHTADSDTVTNEDSNLSNTFKFHFTLSDTENSNKDCGTNVGDSLNSDKLTQTDSSSTANVGQGADIKDTSNVPQENSSGDGGSSSSSLVKLTKGDKSFRFNFPVPETQS